jgi:hypothetical protein
MPEAVRLEVEGRFLALRRRAAAGLLRGQAKRQDFRSISQHPELFELRWRIEHSGEELLIRQYHGEPECLPDILVAVHIHVKRLLIDAEATRAAQNAEISVAQTRYEVGGLTHWGCVTIQPKGCKGFHHEYHSGI